MYSPLEQYKMMPLMHFGVGNYDMSFTNSSLNCLLMITCYYLLFKYNTNRLIPSNYQLLLENIYTFLLNSILDMMGVEGKKYFNLIFTIFLFILTSNLLGMMPYNLTMTSHMIITFGLSFSLWFAMTLMGMLKHGYKLVFLFKPEGTSGALLLLMMPIEFISYLTSPLSLGIRLTANMFAGHTLLNIMAWFTWQMLTMGGMFSMLGMMPMVLMILLIVLELLICFLQSYVFTVLIMSYLNDVIHLH